MCPTQSWTRTPRGTLFWAKRPYARVGDSTTAGVCTVPGLLETSMDALLAVVCCGIDVPKKTLTACLFKLGASGDALIERRVFQQMGV